MSYFVAFVKQLFDIGNSSGSLIIEAINLFRTFQRISAPKVFTTKFSRECAEMFEWATELIEIISSKVRTIPLQEYELFQIYTFVFPLTITMFISCSVIKSLLIITIILFGGMLALGVGTIFHVTDGVHEIMCLSIGGAATVFAIVGLIIAFCCKCGFDNARNHLIVTLSFVSSILVFYLLLIPIMNERWKITLIITIATAVVEFIVLLIATIAYCAKFEEKIEFIQHKVSGFLVTCLNLFIIPSTEKFATLIQGDYKGEWAIIISYVYNSIILPLAMTIAMIILDHHGVTGKYKGNLCFRFVELIDIMKQIGYALAAVYDVIWACLVIEIAWVVLVFAVRPYKNISDYSLTAGSSLILIITNSAIIYSDKHNSKQFSFGVSLFFLIVACVPAIASLYLFFIFDFSDDDYDEDSDLSFGEMNSPGTKLGYIAMFMCPIAWFCYGTNFAYITGIRFYD